MKKIKQLLLVFLLPLILFSSPISSNATTSDQTNSTIQYSVSKISSGGELDEKSSFYDLKATPGEKQTIQARIYNAEDEPITINSQMLTTFTNEHGQIAYTAIPEAFDSSLNYKISEFSTIDDDGMIEVPAKGSKVIQATIDVPKEATGVLLGSWYFEKANQVEGKSTKKGININNKYSYALAVKLTINEIEKPNLEFVKVTPTLRNYQKVIEATIQNDQPTVVSQLKVQAKIMKKGSDKVLFQDTLDNLMMAPNSNFDYPVYLGEQAMKSGEYTIDLTATTKDSKWEPKTWHWTKDFSITAKEAKENTKNAKNDPEAPISIWWYVGGVGLLLVLVALLVYFIMKRKMQKQKVALERKLTNPKE